MKQPQFGISNFAERAAVIVFGMGAVAAILVSTALILVGLFDIIIELVNYFRYAPANLTPDAYRDDFSPGKEVIVAGIQLVELFLLAPLPYLVARSTALFFRDSHLRGEEDAHAFLTVKSLMTTLLIGFIAASVADDAISGKIQPLNALGAAAVMLVLVGYFFVLETVSAKRVERHFDDETPEA